MARSDEILILGSALKRPWITEEDILHALAFAIDSFDEADDVTMVVGPALNGSLIEVGEKPKWGISRVVIHAMDARTKYLRKR